MQQGNHPRPRKAPNNPPFSIVPRRQPPQTPGRSGFQRLFEVATPPGGHGVNHDTLIGISPNERPLFIPRRVFAQWFRFSLVCKSRICEEKMTVPALMFLADENETKGQKPCLASIKQSCCAVWAAAA